MEPPIGEKPQWISYVSDVCGCSRSKVSALCRIARQGCRVSDRTHMSGVRSPQNLLLLRVFVSSLLLSHKCKDSRGPSADPPHQQKKQGSSWNFSSHGPCLSLIHMHTHTLIHRHSHTVSSISAASQQQVSEDRGHLCAGLPLFSSASGHLCGEKTGREEQPTDCLSAPTSTPPRHKISLIRMHLLRHHDLALSISPFSLFCSS